MSATVGVAPYRGRRPWTSEGSWSGARRGDHDAFAELARAAVVRLDQAARLILRDPELARDAVQEGLIRAWRDLPKLRDPDRFDAWLHRLTVNACIDQTRRRRRRPIEVELTPIHAPAVADVSGALAERDQVDAVLRRLDEKRSRDRRPALLPGDAADRGRGDPGHPGRDRQVAPASRPRATMRIAIAAEPTHAGSDARPGRAARMTAEQRLDRDLPGILGDLAVGPYPDYIDDVLATTAQRRQRPAWTFPERWLPMADIASRPAFAPRMPWRTIAVALLTLALIVGAAVAYVGAQRRAPAAGRSVRPPTA